MKTTLLFAATFLLAGSPTTAVVAQVATAQTAFIGLKSDKQKGTVSIQADPTLSDGRLVLKVVAFNPSTRPAALAAENIQVQTAAGKDVPILSLERLIAEVTGDDPARDERTHQSSNYSRPQTTTARSGELDVSGITGASDAIGRSVSGTSRNRSRKTDDPQVQQQVEALRAGVLQSTSIAPNQAGGGQVVTDKIKFGRKEEKSLRVTVSFNGEQHTFAFEAPPAK